MTVKSGKNDNRRQVSMHIDIHHFEELVKIGDGSVTKGVNRVLNTLYGPATPFKTICKNCGVTVHNGDNLCSNCLQVAVLAMKAKGDIS